MPHPFVVARGALPHWPGRAWFVATPPVPSSTDKGRASHPVREGRHFMIARRTAICLIAFGLSAAASIGSAAALDYPTRPVRWVVGYPPGGATDIIMNISPDRCTEVPLPDDAMFTLPGLAFT